MGTTVINSKGDKVSAHGWKSCAECLKPIKLVKGKLTHVVQPEVDHDHEPKVLHG